MTVEQLSGPHPSKPTNPLNAEAFHRTGAVEVWGRGTNRVIEMCEKHGAAPPVFEERQGFLVVTFKAQLVAGRAAPQVTPQAAPQVVRILEAVRAPRSFSELQDAAGLKDRVHFLRTYMEPLLGAGWIERTIPGKPRSPLQRYRITAAGEKMLKEVRS